MINTTNPATARPLSQYRYHSTDELESRLDRADRTFDSWRERSFGARGACLRDVADQLEQSKDELASLMTQEMGKPIAQAESEVEKCAWACRHYADTGEAALAPRELDTDAGHFSVVYQPLGPVLAIMPWNFPLWQVVRCAAPALMAGNVVMVKHAEIVTGCCLALERVFGKAGLPDGAFQSLLITHEDAEKVIRDDRVRGVALTGSERAGRIVAGTAGSALKKTVLELGGSDPFVVLADADMESCVNGAVQGRMMNNGQSCIAAKRFVVEQSVADEFRNAFVRKVEALKVGDPMDRSTDIGPLAREDLLETLEDQVARSVSAGSRILTGGARPSRPGYFYQPTVLDQVQPDHPAGCEELFGPVAAILIANNADHALQIANETSFGLGASVWTRDLKRAGELACRIESGSVFINDIVKSDPRVPFGGIKNSGYGRELGEEGIREFTNVKTIRAPS